MEAERTLTLLTAGTGLRISECLALQWQDVDFANQPIHVRRTWVHGRIGTPKTNASNAPAPLHSLLAESMQRWQQESPYSQPSELGISQHEAEGQKATLREHTGGRLPATSSGQGRCVDEG